MTQKTWFDAFFQALTSSPEFKTVMTTDYKQKAWESIETMKTGIKKASKSLKDSTKKLKESQETVPQASSIFDQFNTQFNTPEAREAAENYKWTQMWVEAKDGVELNIQYFEKKNPATWGFLWIAGMKDLKQELQESFVNPLKFKFFIEKLKNESQNGERDVKTKVFLDLYEKYEKFWVWIPTWIMLYWPPGTGKTFITKKLAEELEAGIIIKTVWEFGSSYMHQTSKNIREFFAKAKKASEKWPLILFLDEIDSLVSKRTDRVDSNKAEEISQFLQEINDLKNAPNLILVWATNRPDHLDSAIMRSGRFDKKVYIGPPDFEARKELFQIFIEKSNRPHEKLEYDELATLTDWYVSADIEAICNEAARDASKSLLDIMHTLQKDLEKKDFTDLETEIHNNVINMDLLKQAIKDTTSSLKMVDMRVYNDWLESLEN